MYRKKISLCCRARPRVDEPDGRRYGGGASCESSERYRGEEANGENGEMKEMGKMEEMEN